MKLRYVFMLCAMLGITITTAMAQDYSKRKLGTHNSMTYMKPRTQAMLVMWPFAKCQSMTYTEQYDFGVRFFDLRIRFIDGVPYFAHGEVEFAEVDAYTVLDYLNKKGDCSVNFVLENTSKIGETQHEAFKALCKEVTEKYKNIHFIGGWTKYPGDHPVIYNFNTPSVAREERYKVFTELNAAVADLQTNKKLNTDKFKSGIKEFLDRPEGFAKQDNPKYWSDWLNDSSKENIVLMLDFPELGAPDAWVKAHSSSSSSTSTAVKNAIGGLSKFMKK